jgi:putative serine protease PepD
MAAKKKGKGKSSGAIKVMPGTEGKQKSNPTVMIVVGVVALVGIVLFLMQSSSDPSPTANFTVTGTPSTPQTKQVTVALNNGSREEIAVVPVTPITPVTPSKSAPAVIAIKPTLKVPLIARVPVFMTTIFAGMNGMVLPMTFVPSSALAAKTPIIKEMPPINSGFGMAPSTPGANPLLGGMNAQGTMAPMEGQPGEPLAPVDPTVPAVPAIVETLRTTTLDESTLKKRIKPSLIQLQVKSTDHDKTGTGFIITANGMAVTNLHVMQRALSATAVLSNDDKVEVIGIIKVDPLYDLAVIQLAPRSNPYVPVPLSATIPAVNSVATAFTTDQSNSIVVKSGPILSVRSALEVRPLFGYEFEGTWLQSAIPFYPHNDGGLLVDDKGNCIGLMTAQLSMGQNLNLSLSAETLLAQIKIPLPQIPTDLKSIEDPAVLEMTNKLTAESMRRQARDIIGTPEALKQLINLQLLYFQPMAIVPDDPFASMYPALFSTAEPVLRSAKIVLLNTLEIENNQPVMSLIVYGRNPRIGPNGESTFEMRIQAFIYVYEVDSPHENPYMKIWQSEDYLVGNVSKVGESFQFPRNIAENMRTFFSQLRSSVNKANREFSPYKNLMPDEFAKAQATKVQELMKKQLDSTSKPTLLDTYLDQENRKSSLPAGTVGVKIP